MANLVTFIINTEDSNQKGLAASFFSSGNTAIQEFFNRDKSIDAMIRPVKPSEGVEFPWEEDYDADDVLYLQIGNVDGRPTNGTFALSYGVGGSTGNLAYDISAAGLKTALEAIGTGTVTVTLLTPGVYQVDWSATGVVSTPILGDADLLIPACEIDVTVTNEGSSTEREQRIIDLREAKVCAATFNTPFAPASPSVTQKAANSSAQNAIYEINLGDAYAGGYTLSLTAGGVTSSVVLSAEMDAENVGIALAAHPVIEYQSFEIANNIAVSKSKNLITVQFIGALGGVASARTITANSVASPTVVTCADHGLKTGDSIVISGSDSTPTIDGTRTVTVLSINSFSVPVNVTSAGNTGSFYATTQPAIAFGSDTSLKYPKGFTGTINLNTIALAKAFWSTTADTLTFPLQITRVRDSGEERTIFGDDVTLKRQLVDTSTIVPVFEDGEIVIAAGKTVTFSNSITFTGTDGTSHIMPATSSTIARTDAAQTFAGKQTFDDLEINSTVAVNIATTDTINLSAPSVNIISANGVNVESDTINLYGGSGVGIGINDSAGTVSIFGTLVATPEIDMLRTLGAEVSVSTATTLTASAFGKMHVVSGTSANYIILLPAASGNVGKIIGIRIANGATKLFTIDANASELIDGELTRPMWAGESAILYCDGSGWVKLMGRTRPMTCSGINSSQTSMPNSTATKVTLGALGSESISGMLASNKITAQRKGQYMVSALVSYERVGSTSGAETYVQVYKNGAVAVNPAITIVTPSSTTGGNIYAMPSTSGSISLNGGDYIELYGIQTTGSTMLTRTVVDQVKSSLTLVEIPTW